MNFTQFIKDVLNQFGQNIQIGIPAVIDSFDKSAMRANVKFYLQTEDREGNATDYPIVPNIPVQFLYSGGFYIRPDYQPGDNVWVTFATFDISDALDENTMPESGLFGMHNASVAGGIASNKFTAPASFSNDGLLIGMGDNTYIQFDASGNIVMTAAGLIQFKNQSTSLLTLLNAMLDAIIAITVSTGVGPSSPPINAATFTTIKAQLAGLMQ